MSNAYPEPRRFPGHMRAADADRAIVTDLLSAAYAEGRLTREEHDSRLAQAMEAKTFDDLRGLTDDLVPGSNTGRTIGAFSSAGAPHIDRSGAETEAETTFAIFGGMERAGSWRARRNISNLTAFGGSSFDFRDAVFTSDEVTINIFCAFGGVDVVVPEGVNVRNETVAIFGGSDVKNITPAPGGPTVILKGLVLFGGIDAKGKRRH
ncbi:MAG TPA: DUF1707 domain-containing protein [Propionibacterium sp.]|nr:DUF1707 domain-containing protein [Propionibacterium sp.]